MTSPARRWIQIAVMVLSVVAVLGATSPADAAAAWAPPGPGPSLPTAA